MPLRMKTEQVRTLQELGALVASLEPGYVHRGQSNSEWPLQTSLERSCPAPSRPSAERSLLAAFKSRAHHYNAILPSENDDLEWLALMQHFGAPTRLLDWTRSPYVAAYFGAENATKGNTHFSVWCVNVATLKRCALEIVNGIANRFIIDPLHLPSDIRFGDPSVFKAYLLGNRYTLVAPVQARRMNERLTTQQGMFLSMGNVNKSFADNLAAVSATFPGDAVVRIDIPVAAREAMLDALDTMNINRATLFPGLDGFAQHLRTRISMDRGPDAAVLREFGFL